MGISVYIIAYNEAEKIKDCINSVLWADEIIVADSNSTDGTSEIAASLGAKVIHIPFNGYGALRNEALSYCTNEWILSIDSDERCTEEVRDEILSLIKKTSLDIFNIPRKNFFMGKWIKHSGWYPNFRQPQLFRKNMMSAKLEDKKVNGTLLKAFFHGFWAFIKHYFFKLGFLDGGAGFVIAFSNFEGTFYRYLKLTEKQSNWKMPSVKPIHKIK